MHEKTQAQIITGLSVVCAGAGTVQMLAPRQVNDLVWLANGQRQSTESGFSGVRAARFDIRLRFFYFA